LIYSVLNDFIGFAIAALIASKLTVMKAVSKTNIPATVNIHQEICVRYAKSSSHLFITYHATGIAITLANKTSFKKFPDNIAAVFQRFEQNDQCGIVATKEYIITEPFEENKFSGINGQLLDELVLTYGLRPDSFEFVAGTMFWVRAAPLLQFFARFNPLEIRKQLENGNVIDNFSGTVTHSWERLLSWIVTSNKMFITGI